MSSEHRLHPYSVLFAFVTQIRVFIVPGILLYFGIGSRENEWWQPWMMAFIVPSAGVAVVRYLTYRFRYEENDLVIRTGLLFRKERHIPYGRIQNIDAVQNVLHRLLNVVDIKIETGGGQSAEATMSVLPLDALAEMRRRVFSHRTGTQPDASPDALDDTMTGPKPLLRLSVRELLLCGFIENRGAVLVAAAFGLVWEFGVFDRIVAPVFGEPMFGRGALRNLIRGAVSSATMSARAIALTVAGVIAALVAMRVFSMAWAVVRLYGFRLALVEGDARTEFGLLTRVALTVPLRRVQSLTIRESPLHRYFGRVAIKVDTAGGRADQQQQQSEREYFAPILARAAVDDFVRQIVGVTVDDTAWRPAHPRAFRREVKVWLIPAGFISAGVAVYAGWYALLVVPFAVAWATVGARQTVRHLGWALTDEAILFKSGWLWRRVVVARFAKIQTVSRYTSPFDRRHHMARVHVDTAGASAASSIHIPYLAADAAEALYIQLSREAAERQLRW